METENKNSSNPRHVNVIDAGHTYELHHHQDPNSDSDVGVETIKFVKKEQQGKEGDPLTTVQNGTTNEAVLEMMLDRLQHLNSIMYDELNDKAIAKIKDALECLYRRTRKRETRGVEGTDKE